MPQPNLIAVVAWLVIAAVITANGQADASPGAVVPYQPGINAVRYAYLGGVYSPNQNRVYLAPYGQSDQSTWHYIDGATGAIVGYEHGVTAEKWAYRGGVYSPTLDRVYFAPYRQSYFSTWHYIDCATGTVVGYEHGVTAVWDAYHGGVYSPTQDRVYLVPFVQALESTTWHYIDGATGVVVGYEKGVTAVLAAYVGGVYSPTQDRVYLVPLKQGPESTWHYIDCATGTVVGYEHGVTAVLRAYAGGVYSPTQDRVYLVPHQQAPQSTWHYIDCATGTVVGYEHGVTAVDRYYGGVYSPAQDRVYLVPYRQAPQSTWHYIDGTMGTVVGYEHGVTADRDAYVGGVYSPTQGRVYLVPYDQALESTWHYVDTGTAPPTAPPADAPPADAPIAEDYACRTNIWVKYTQPVTGPRLGPIVLGRGANGAAISLYPGTFTASSEVYVCNGATNVEMANAAYRGEVNVVYDGSSSMSIVIYAIDVRQPLNEASLENFAPLVMSIEINAQTLDVGETATITATAYDFNAADTLKKMALSVFDTTDDGDISREDGPAADAMVNSFTSGRMNIATLEFTPAVTDFTDSNASAHRLLATVTATDTFDAEGNGQVPLTVNRLVGVKIGAVTFNRPRVSLDVNKQSHSSVAGTSTEAAVAKFDIFDADSVVPYPYPEYRESHTYHIESIAAPVNAIAPADVAVGANLNNFPTPGNCFGGGCQYTECVCTRSAVADDDGNFGCNEINATKAGDEWTFTWNPWSEVDSTLYGVTFCELKVHFVDNTASASQTGSVTQVTEGLTTQTATILLEANPGASSLNFPPTVSLFHAAHIDLEVENTIDTTITVIFEDAESAFPPSSELGYLGLGCVTPDEESCFVPIAAAPTQTPVDPTPAGQAGAWVGVYTFNGNTALPDASGSTLKVYLKLTDTADSSMVGYHEMATLTRLAARRRRRRQDSGDAAALRTAGMTISIDENGRLTGQMEFPAGAVVRVDVDTAGGSTGAPDRRDDDRGDDHGDDHIRPDDGSPDRRLVIIVALAGGAGCCCSLGAAICLGYAKLRRNGTARVGPSPTRRPTKILVSGAAPGLDGPWKDPFVGFQTA